MIRRALTALLALTLAAGPAAAQVRTIPVLRATTTPTPVIAPAAPLPAPSSALLAPSLAGSVPTLAAAAAPSAVAGFATTAAGAKSANRPAPAPANSPAAPNDEGLSPQRVKALRQAWISARSLLEPVPGAPETLAESSLVPEPGRIYWPSPQDWRDESFYFVLIDRFARSGAGRPVGDQSRGDSRKGGNLRGVIEKLDYLKGLGVTTLMLSPVQQNLPESYHGYAPIHLMAVDPHLGTMADMKELVAQAHARGMKVVLDWVLNHAGPVFEYKDGSQFSATPKEIGEWTAELKPRELAAPEHFTRRGVIDDWNDPAQKNHGDFPPNYRHWASDNPDTAAKLIQVANWWIKETDIDGLRLDAVRHLAPGFLPKFAQDVKAYARSLGKHNFFLVGENSTGDENDLAPYLGPGKLDSLFQYASFRRDNKALHGAAPSAVLEASHIYATRVLGEATGRMLRFFDNHDTYRFLRAGEPLARLHLALAYLIFSIGIPILYAGTEQAMRQPTGSLEPEGPHAPADPDNREPMFDKADPLSATYAFIAKLLGLRAEHEALRRGDQWVRWSDPNAPGLFIFSRLHKGREIVVALNFGMQERQADPWVDRAATPAGTVLRDALDPSYRPAAYAAESGSKIHLRVPPLGMRVLIREP